MCRNQPGLAWRGEGAQVLSLGDLDWSRRQGNKGEREALTLRKGLDCESIVVELWRAPHDDDFSKCHIINITYLALTYLIMPLRWHYSRDGNSCDRDVLYAPMGWCLCLCPLDRQKPKVRLF